MKTHSKGMALFAALLLLISTVAFAQGDQGRIAGVVKDSTGAVIPGVSISVKNDKTGEERTALTEDGGVFVVNGLRPSAYSVRALLSGFAPTEMKAVQLVAGQKLNLELTINPAGLNESITVETAAEASVDTSSASIGVNVDLREVGSLPINGRQLSQLYLQAPGAQNTGSGTFGDVRFSGRAVEQNAIRFDGIEGSGIVDAAPGVIGGELASPFRLQSSLENVQEFRVESNNYPAEYGTGTGGQVSVVTKSGGNVFHGSIFEYIRNDIFDARNFFDRESTGGLTKLPLRMNQFGGSLGGPLVKNRVFFFGSFEAYRLRNGVNLIEAAPSAAAKAIAVAAGSATAPIIDAFHDPRAVILPGASTDPNYEIYQLQARNLVNENAFSLRFDFKLNDKNTMYARFFRDQGYNVQPQSISGRTLSIRTFPQNGVLALQSIISNRTVNEVKFGYNGALTRGFGQAPVVNGIDTTPLTINFTGSASNAGIPGQGASTGSAVAGGLVRLNSQANGRGAPYTPWTLSFIDSLTWISGNHNVKIGGEFRPVRFYTDRNGGTQYTFGNLADLLNNRNASVRYIGDLSDPSVFNNGATGQREGKQEYYIAYAQDEWKLAPYLTLNYGARYEYYSPVREARNLNVQFDINTGKLLPAANAFYKSSKSNIGPRIGLSYSPALSTVIRGGFGIFYGPGQTEDLLQPIESDIINTVFSGTFPINIDAVRTNFANNVNNRQYAPRAYSPDYNVPERVYQYSLSMQQEVPGGFVASAAYVGSQGRNLFLRSIANRIISVAPATGTVTREFDIPVAGSVTPLRPFAEIDYKTSGGHDSYNALQLSLVKRSNKGLTMNSQYTLGRSWGNSAGSNEAVTAANNARAIKDFDFEEGYNNFDIRHNFNASLVYALPIGKGKAFLADLNPLANALLGGWEIGGIANARSGLPVNVLITRPDVVFVDGAGLVYTNAGAGRTAVINTPGGGSSRATRRPDLIPGANIFLNNDRTLLNAAAFTVPKPGTFGNFPRNGGRGPNYRQVDVMLSKKFALTETANVEFRTEVFNAFNFTNFSAPPATLSPAADSTGKLTVQPGQPLASTTFGVMTSTVERSVGLGTNRQIQFALRLSF